MPIAGVITPQLVIAVVAIVAVVVLRLFGDLTSEQAGTLVGTLVGAFGLGAGHQAKATNGAGE